MTTKRMLPPTYLLLGIATIAALQMLLPLRHILAFPWRLVGVAFFLAGLTLDLVADRQFKERGTTVKPFEKSTSLVTSPAYRVSRNPMYIRFVLRLLGIEIVMGSLSSFFIVSLFAVPVEVVFIRTEEHMMDVIFGENWLASMTRAWRGI